MDGENENSRFISPTPIRHMNSLTIPIIAIMKCKMSLSAGTSLVIILCILLSNKSVFIFYWNLKKLHLISCRKFAQKIQNFGKCNFVWKLNYFNSSITITVVQHLVSCIRFDDSSYASNPSITQNVGSFTFIHIIQIDLRGEFIEKKKILFA